LSGPAGSAPRRLGPHLGVGLAVAAAVFVADLASKLWVLDGLALEATGPIRITPWLDFVLVWNRGVSYGLFQQDGETGRWILVGVTVVATVALAAWMARTTSRLSAVALGLVVGGAVGNGVDRVVYGAVVDFVHFHVADFSWYVFNVADAAIVAGAALIVLEALRGDRSAKRA
jgi:signal peptidase II